MGAWVLIVIVVANLRPAVAPVYFETEAAWQAVAVYYNDRKVVIKTSIGDPSIHARCFPTGFERFDYGVAK